MALNGVYRFLYYFLMKKIPIKDVPSGLEDDVFELEGVELGKYALQLPPPSDTKVAPADGDADLSKPRYTVDLSAIELQPLIQRVESAESKFDSAESKFDSKFNGIDIRIDGIDSKFNGIDSKFDGIDLRFNGIDSKFDGRFNGIDSRFDGMEAKLNGILEALSKAPQ
jgi:hypothetical protein